MDRQFHQGIDPHLGPQIPEVKIHRPNVDLQRVGHCGTLLTLEQEQGDLLFPDGEGVRWR